MTRRYVGERVPRREDGRLVTGRGGFIDNLPAPGALHMAVVRSPFAHARIERVDTTSALAVTGVVAAFSGEDLMPEWSAPLPMMWPVTDEVRNPDHWPLAPDVARYAGDGVAVVVARSAAAARDGADAVEVDFEPLPFVLDAEAALADGAPLVHPEFGSNLCYRFGFMVGDVDGAIRASDVVVRRRLRIPRVLPSPMETRGVLAQPGSNGDVVLRTTTQVPHILRRLLVGTVGLSEHQLRVVVPEVGGAFGSKLNVYAEEALAVALARRLGAPVRWVEDRSEHAVATAHGRGQTQDFEVAARSDGTMVAVRVSLLVSMGAYLQLESPGIPILGRLMFGGQYGAEAYGFESVSVFTNEPPTGAYRGVGRAEALYGIERMMDHLARELGMDPAEIRRRNFLSKGADVSNAAGIPYDSVDYEPAFDRALAMSGYESVRSEQAQPRQHGDSLIGIGIGSYVDSSGMGSSPLLSRTNYQGGGWESGRVRVLPTGAVEVFTGTVPQGQGHETAWAQVAADALGVAVDDVAVVWGDTAAVPQGTGTFGSRSLNVGGSAILLAARRIESKARRIAAHLLEASEDDVGFSDGRFAVSGAPERGLSLADVSKAAHFAHNLPAGMEPALDERVFFEPPDWTYPFGTHVAVVEVDPETGEVRLLRYVAVDDCGTVVNPMLVEGQLHGGIAQGIGQALFEEVRFGEAGGQETASFLTYLLPSPPDLPSFEIERTVTPTTINPLGAKGVAEGGAVAAPAAVMNAVVDALANVGVDDVDMPATPERVWAALRRASPAGSTV
jgi:carbon-monoxide dehydrogenase large subunit